VLRVQPERAVGVALARGKTREYGRIAGRNLEHGLVARSYRLVRAVCDRLDTIISRLEAPDFSQRSTRAGEDVAAATAANGHACVLPMKRRLVDQAWIPAEPGWGLLAFNAT
jgi:hypothetical protein